MEASARFLTPWLWPRWWDTRKSREEAKAVADPCVDDQFRSPGDDGLMRNGGGGLSRRNRWHHRGDKMRDLEQEIE